MMINIDGATLERMQLSNQQSLLEFSKQQAVLLVFLRHFGCVFCKEAMTDLAALKPKLNARGAKLVFVHMAKPTLAEKYLREFNLAEIPHISDPQKKFYYAFGLRKGTFTQLYGLRTWFRGFSPEVKEHKLELSAELGDSTQMPGIFLLQDGEIKDHYIHRAASDRPDYTKLLECCAV